MNILDNSRLTYPFRNQSEAPLTHEEVAAYISQNEAGKAVVLAAGGISEWIRKTGGGKLDPRLWPFELPKWPPEEVPVDRPRVVTPSHDPFKRIDTDHMLIVEMYNTIADISEKVNTILSHISK